VRIESLRAKWEASGKPVFVFACAYCMRLFGGFLPEVEKVSLYELLAETGMNAAGTADIGAQASRSSVVSGQWSVVSEHGDPHDMDARASRLHGSFAVFDPCTARDFPDMENAVRKLAVDRGVSITELSEKNHCCGFGGHMRTANPDLYDTVVERRSSANDAPYLVYCANCARTFDLAGKSSAHILDLVFNTDDAAAGGNESLQKQRDNAVRAKAALVELYESGDFKPAARPWDDLRVNIPDSLVAEMSARLILFDDVKEAIYESERAGTVFVLPGGNPSGGELRQCCLIREVVTTWAQYIRHGETAGDYDYTVVDVWNHRMRFSDTPD
jgi:hypothetical protein